MPFSWRPQYNMGSCRINTIKAFVKTALVLLVYDANNFQSVISLISASIVTNSQKFFLANDEI